MRWNGDGVIEMKVFKQNDSGRRIGEGPCQHRSLGCLRRLEVDIPIAWSELVDRRSYPYCMGLHGRYVEVSDTLGQDFAMVGPAMLWGIKRTD